MSTELNGIEHGLHWIEQRQQVHDTDSYPTNRQAVQEDLVEQLRRCEEIREFGSQLSLADHEAVSNGQKSLSLTEQQALDTLKATADRRLSCLKTMSEIDNLEHLFGSLAHEFSLKAVDLVKSVDLGDKSCDLELQHKAQTKLNGHHSQSDILGIRSNWSWISKQLKCADVHLQNAAEYHQFFYDVSQYRQCMLSELSKTTSLLDQQKIDRNSHGPMASQLLFEMKAAITMFLTWSKKVDALFERSKKIVPLDFRTRKIDHHLPVKALCSYKTAQITIQEGEQLTLLDNSQTQHWQVRNERAQTGEVPSVILLIPGPDTRAVQAALQLRLELLAVWTVEWKRIGKSIVWFLLQVIRDWTPEEEKMLRALSDTDKTDLVAMLDAIDKTFAVYWQCYQPYLTLHDRTVQLRQKVHAKQNGTDDKFDVGQLLVIQTAIVIELLARYRDYWHYWEIFKILTETTRHPEYLLVVENWREYNFIEITDWLRKWQLETVNLESVDGIVEETIESEIVESLESEKYMLERDKETAETSHLTSSELEERQTFVITGVTDPRTGDEISFDEAISLGIINQHEGRYVNPKTGESQPIQMAMNAGKIKVELTTVKKSEEKRRDIGLITIKSYKESRPFTVKSVVDAMSEKQLSVDEAIRAKILDLKRGIYINKTTNEELTLADALDSGLLIVEFETEVTNGKHGDKDEDVVTKTYAVHCVVDVGKNKRLTFKEALDGGIVDADKGTYLNTSTGEQMLISDAFKKGLIKGTVVHDVQALDPNSRITVADTAVSNFKKPMKALKALKTVSH
jgi:hypothetical protein